MTAPAILTEAQKAEFPTERLQAFASAYLTFQRSSPCTARHRQFAYFAPPPDSQMSQDDIMFGPDREDAYRRLMWEFRRCQRGHELDRYFGPGHTKFWESGTVSGLVLLHEWKDEPTALPGVYTGRIQSIRPEMWDRVWICVRSLKAMPKNPLGNIEYVRVLSPSEPLWRQHLALKKAGKWGEAAFQGTFAPQFLREMLAPEPYDKLKELAELSKHETVLIACYCDQDSLCHRSLLKKIIDTMKEGDNPDEAE